jgi:hypothetical protein
MRHSLYMDYRVHIETETTRGEFWNKNARVVLTPKRRVRRWFDLLSSLNRGCWVLKLGFGNSEFPISVLRFLSGVHWISFIWSSGILLTYSSEVASLAWRKTQELPRGVWVLPLAGWLLVGLWMGEWSLYHLLAQLRQPQPQLLRSHFRIRDSQSMPDTMREQENN